ncbi:MAG: DUF1700 domain-containing protein [Candidatus Izemoplasmatales bacterium]|jgi:uncharacterized membrane protein|nr:DUF1700 domain-containing protein [Candidatus Izemoplasmatales bacterium]
MTKKTFIETLKVGLAKMNISDFDDIIRDYETHFANELAKGKSEEEIASEIGDINQILADFAPEAIPQKESSGRGALFTGLVISDFFVFLFFVIAYILILVPIALFASGCALGIYYSFGINIISVFPIMPYWIGLLFGLDFFFLGLIGLSSIYYYARFLSWMTRKYRFWHQSVLKKTEKQFIGLEKSSRIMNKIIVYSSFGFLIFAVFGYIIAAISAGSLEFWHVWDWFV